MFRSSALNFFFALGFAIFFLGVMPLWNLTARLGFHVIENEKLLDELRGLQQKKDQLLRSYNLISPENIEKLEAVIPTPLSSFDISTLYLFFETIGRENGIRMEMLTITRDGESGGKIATRRAAEPSFSTLPNETSSERAEEETAQTADNRIRFSRGNEVKELRIALRAIGNYDSFKSFLKAMENSLRLIDVNSFLITSASAENKLSYAINLTMYHQE